MSRTRGVLSALVVSIVAAFTMQTMQALSWPAEERQIAREGVDVEKLLTESDCRSCHATDRKVVGPSYTDVAKRYAAEANAAGKLAERIREGGSGNWGSVRMTAHPDLKDEQLAQIVVWILSLKEAGAAPAEEAKAKQYKYDLNNGKTVTLDFPVFVEGNDKKVVKDVFRGYQLYNSYCYRCHGTDATTSELAPDLRRFNEAGTTQDFLSVAMTGREDKGMPNWAGFLSKEEVQQIYQYVKGRSLELVPAGRPPSEFD